MVTCVSVRLVTYQSSLRSKKALIEGLGKLMVSFILLLSTRVLQVPVTVKMLFMAARLPLDPNVKLKPLKFEVSSVPLSLKSVTLHVPEVTVEFTAAVLADEGLLSSLLLQAVKTAVKIVNARIIFFILFKFNVVKNKYRQFTCLFYFTMIKYYEKRYNRVDYDGFFIQFIATDVSKKNLRGYFKFGSHR